jgi:hypothetical protein
MFTSFTNIASVSKNNSKKTLIGEKWTTLQSRFAGDGALFYCMSNDLSVILIIQSNIKVYKGSYNSTTKTIDWDTNSIDNLFSPNTMMSAVACSSSGQYIYLKPYATGTKIWRSSNYGSSFTLSTVSNFTGRTGCIACSSSGQYVLAASSTSTTNNNCIYYSSDYGVNFSNCTLSVTLANPPGYSLTISNDGTKCMVCNSSAGFIHYSSNSGSTWTSYDISSKTGTGPVTVNCTDDGTFFCCKTEGPVYASTNPTQASNWTIIGPTDYLSTQTDPNIGFHMNARGTTICVAGSTTTPREKQLLISTNNGSTWYYGILPSGVTFSSNYICNIYSTFDNNVISFMYQNILYFSFKPV